MADPIFAFLATSSLLKYLILSLWNNKVPKHAKLVGRVSELYIHPVKSCGAIDLSEATCTFTGMSSKEFCDRNWLVTLRQDGGDRKVDAKREPTLQLIRPSIHGGYLHLDAPGMPTLKLPKYANVTGAQIANTNMFGEEINGVDCGDRAAKWLQDYLKKTKDNHRLLQFASCFEKRNCSKSFLVGKYTDTAKDTDNVVYQNVAPFLLCTQQSLDDLNDRLYKTVSIRNFRPNIVVTGCSRPFEEDSWLDIWIGDAKFTKFFLCSRCMITTVNPITAEKDPRKEPKATLDKYRSLVPKEGPIFGITLVANKPADIKVGDLVYATTTTEVVVGTTGITIDVSE